MELFDNLESPQGDYPMRAPCPQCGHRQGLRQDRGGQALIYCAKCGTHCYNAPKTETGDQVRSIRSRPNLRPGKRARIFDRDGSRCAICNADAVPLHVGHIISVAAGRNVGLTDQELFADENLCVMCEECNIGFADQPMSLPMMARILRSRLRYAKSRSRDETA